MTPIRRLNNGNFGCSFACVKTLHFLPGFLNAFAQVRKTARSLNGLTHHITHDGNVTQTVIEGSNCGSSFSACFGTSKQRARTRPHNRACCYSARKSLRCIANRAYCSSSLFHTRTSKGGSSLDWSRICHIIIG